MIRFILSVYDTFRRRPALGWSIFAVLTSALLLSMLTLAYKEDISDFLPLDEQNQTNLSIYQEISGANNIYAIISARDTTSAVDPQVLADGVELFCAGVEEADSLHYLNGITKEVDMEKMLSVSDFVYDNIPYFLTDRDYARIDSLLSSPGYVDTKVADDKQMLLFPSSSMVTDNISRDPLDLFSPAPSRLRHAGMQINFETYDGYILSPDRQRAIVIMESAFGSHESDNNARLADMLAHASEKAESENSAIDVHLVGGPVIAVTNARQIKNDSILAVSIAGLLILALLIYVFRNVRNILLIVVSVGWGWLFAMGAIALYYDSVSIIVIGIASVILGIAVNYPLHLIDHLQHSSNPRRSLKEIISPLVVGNITTVGAFLCLVPLNAPALHDLGLFSSLLLVGTILFVLIFLPHAVRTRRMGAPVHDPRLITRLAGVTVENNRALVIAVLFLTAIFGYFSLHTEFDSDMRNINYMTPEQRSDMAYFNSLAANDGHTENLYIVSSGKTWDEAMESNSRIDATLDSIVASGIASRSNEVSSFLIPKEEQEHRLRLWRDFIDRHADALGMGLDSAAAANGFSPEAFSRFREIIEKDYGVQEFDYFRPLSKAVFAGNVSQDETSGRKSIVQTLNLDRDRIDDVKRRISANREFGGHCFDVSSMNGAIADTLSGDFNYIGIACGFIVFIFLWISLGSLELAIVSFLPMAFSWVWILGIMAILGIKFNIVNIILATFIFGQGDDYTIFMTEGLSYELAYRRRLLASYKSSIIVSALIMFIGIGTLLFARHPAMRSLGEVTVVGMLSVVLMAYLFPPLVFNFLVRKNGRLRFRPLTLGLILKKIFGCLAGHRNDGIDIERIHADGTSFANALILAKGRYLYKGYDIVAESRRNIKRIRGMKEMISDLVPGAAIRVDESAAQGELALVLALMYPHTEVTAIVASDDVRDLLAGCAEDFTPNLKIRLSTDTGLLNASDCKEINYV